MQTQHSTIFFLMEKIHLPNSTFFIFRILSRFIIVPTQKGKDRMLSFPFNAYECLKTTTEFNEFPKSNETPIDC